MFGFPSQRDRATERALIEAQSQNEFLRAQAEAAAILNAELIAMCAARDAELRRLSQPRREPRKDKGTIRANAARVVEQLTTAKALAEGARR